MKSLLTARTPMIFAVIFGSLALAALGCIDRGEREMHILPYGYTGPVLIIFDRPDGKPEAYDDGRRVYEIPPSGVLLTQFGTNEGWVPHGGLQFFWQKEDGSRTPIPVRLIERLPDSVIQAYGLQLGVAGDGSTSATYESYVIGVRDTTEAMARVFDQFTDSVFNAYGVK